MEIWSIFLLSCALAADAFAVSLCKGFSVQKITPKHYVTVALYFGGFQALMPLLGFYLGITLASFIADYDHWIVFGLLCFIGFKMIKESFQPQECASDSNEFGYKTMFPLALATSIDALAVGVSFAVLETNLLSSIACIGLVTAIFCVIALKVGNTFGLFLGRRAELLGGVILVLLGVKILIEHLFFGA